MASTNPETMIRPVSLPLSSIRPGQNPRRYSDQTKHAELVASLKLRGLLQPVLVCPAPEGDDGYVLVAGGRRFRAAQEAFGADGEVPVTIRDMTDQQALEAAIDENDVRDNASETEQADAAARVLAACKDDRAGAAKRLGWSPAMLARRLALADLSTPKTSKSSALRMSRFIRFARRRWLIWHSICAVLKRLLKKVSACLPHLLAPAKPWCSRGAVTSCQFRCSPISKPQSRPPWVNRRARIQE